MFYIDITFCNIRLTATGKTKPSDIFENIGGLTLCATKPFVD
jgi:hypothetical protein